MAEFQHYGVESDVSSILRHLFEEGFLVIPEEPILAEPRLVRFSTYAPEIEAKLRRYPVALIEGSFTRYPLEFSRRQNGEAAGTYFVDSTSGPRVRWSIPSVTTAADVRQLVPGSLSYTSSYRNPTTREWESPDSSLKEAFRKMVAILKQHMIQITAGREKLWVGADAKQALDDGDLILER